MDTVPLRERLDAQDRARAFNRNIKQGKRYYAISPLAAHHGRMTPVTKFRVRKGGLQAQSQYTGNWFGVTFENVRVAV